MLGYTCNICTKRSYKKISKQAYYKGVVYVQCQCDSKHLIADNMGWFKDSKTTIEDIINEKGESIQKMDMNDVDADSELNQFITKN